jgi:hypothetical protein
MPHTSNPIPFGLDDPETSLAANLIDIHSSPPPVAPIPRINASHQLMGTKGADSPVLSPPKVLPAPFLSSTVLPPRRPARALRPFPDFIQWSPLSRCRVYQSVLPPNPTPPSVRGRRCRGATSPTSSFLECTDPNQAKENWTLTAAASLRRYLHLLILCLSHAHAQVFLHRR